MVDLRDDILSEDLKTVQPKIIVQRQFESIISTATVLTDRSVTPGKAKNIIEFYSLVKEAVEDCQTRNGAVNDSKVVVTQEKPDVLQDLETITISLVRREPGRFSEGSPFSGDVRNLRPIFREEVADPDNPGYRKAVLGYWHDNLVRFTCWARTNKQANARALWFEGLMEDYIWFFRMRGVSRVLYQGCGSDEVLDPRSQPGSSTNKYYGRPIDYFVKTETLRTVSEKELERLIINIR